MKKILNFIDEYSTYFFACCALFVLGVQLWALNRGYIMSDEGWFSVLLRDRPIDQCTQYFMLFGNIFRNSLFASRLCAWVLLIVGACVLSCGVCSCKKTYRFADFVYSFSIIVLGYAIVGPLSINYAVLTTIVGEMSVGLLLLGLSKQKWYYYFLCGFVIATLIPIKITATIIIPFVAVLICITSKEKKSILSFMLGGLIFLALYFILCESPSDYFSVFVNNTSKTIDKGSENYGIWSVFSMWNGAYIYAFELVLLSLYIAYVVKQKRDSKISNRTFVIALMAMLLFFILDNTLNVKGKGIGRPYYLFWLFAISMLINADSCDKKMFWIVCFTLFAPFCLTFGSDGPRYAQPHYVPLVMAAVLLLMRNRLHNILMVMLVLIQMYSFSYGITKYDWAGNKWLAQTESVYNLGINQNLKLSKFTYSQVENAQKYVSKGDYVICDFCCWGYVELLDLKPLNYSFFENEQDIQDIESYILNDKTIIVILQENDLSKDLREYLDYREGVQKYKLGGMDYLYKYTSRGMK